MKIEISNISDNKSISLLTEIIKMGQKDYEDLSLENSSLKNTNEELKGKLSTLEKDNEKLNGELSTLGDTNKELEGKLSILGESNGELNGKLSALGETNKELKGKLSTLEKDNEKLNGELSTLGETNKELEGRLSTLGESNEELKGKLSVLEESNAILEKKVNDSNLELANKTESLSGIILHDKLTVLRMLLEHSISIHEDIEENWIEFINTTISGIEETIQSISDVKGTLFKIQAKNGWLTKLASLCWWSSESHVGQYIPRCLGNNSIFNEYFNIFLSYLDSQDIHINLPEGDFASDFSNYKADYDEKSLWVKRLFPNYHPDDYILCEINFLSINSNQGKCTGC